MMNKILLLGIILYSCLFHVRAQDLEISDCPTTSNYTSNSPFQTNLNLLLSHLVENGTRDGFFNTTVGSDPNTVYGLVSCRGDLSPDECGVCLNSRAVEIIQLCPNGTEATLRYAECLLRYSNRRFFSQGDLNRRAMVNTGNIPPSEMARNNEELGALIRNLSQTAISRESRYSSGSAATTNFDDVYGMAQCTRDLSPTTCESCLQRMFSWIPTCCNNSRGARIFSTTCIIRYETLPFLNAQQPSPPPPPPPVDNSPPPPPPNGLNIAAIVAPIVVGVLLLAICAYFTTRRIRKKKMEKKPDIIYDQDDITSEESLHFGLNTIRTATADFSNANKLGEGGFGAVYRGELLDGQEIAVKRLSKNSGQGSQEFKNEVVLLHKLQHRNLVRLLGYCLAGEEKLLIYEYVPNRSLDKYIFDPMKKAELDWERRYKIVGGIARGLLYLHEDSRLRIIHRDLKAGNILLDEEMNAKIADFGMAKLFGVDQTQGNTSRIAGTFGYMAPEYALHGLFSVKSDVFSFGVLLLEIVSGQKTNSFQIPGVSKDLLSYAWKVWKEGEPLKLIDPALMNNFAPNEVMRCIHIGLLCVQENLDDRPTMSSVVLMLNSYSLTLEAPRAPAFIFETRTGANDPKRDLTFSDSTTRSLLQGSDTVSLAIPR